LVKSAVLAKPCSSGALGIVRVQTAKDLVLDNQSASRRQIFCLEITMTTPEGLRAIEEAREKLPGDFLMGAGRVLDAPTARQAILDRARFLVAHRVALDVIKTAHRYGVPVILGAMVTTEILTCWEVGTNLVKVFLSSILGPEFIKTLYGPLPQIPLVPAGRDHRGNTGEFIRTGAMLVCAGGWLVDKKAVAEGFYEVLTEWARKPVGVVRKSRQGVGRC